MTNKTYFTSSAAICRARVVRIIAEPSPVVFLDQTIVAPQGGGQPSDLGWIGPAKILRADYADDDNIAHTVDSVDGLRVGEEVEVRIDADRRAVNSRYHTAGHLIAGVAERLLPSLRAKGGHHWPGEARVEFQCEIAPPSGFESTLAAELRDAIEAGGQVSMTDGVPPPRIVTIQNFPPLPCGGTHIGTLADLGEVTIRSCKWKKGCLRVGYDVDNSESGKGLEPVAFAD